MEEKEVIERLTRAEARSKSNTHRLDKLEPIVDEIHTMSKAMVQLVQEVKHIHETVCSLDGRVQQMDVRMDDMERRPADNLNTYKRTAVTAMISTIAGAFATGMIFIIANTL